MDLFPTICDYSNVSLSSHYFGKSIRPLVSGKQDKIHDFIVMETVFVRGTREYGLRGRSLRTPGYKYIVYSAGELREVFRMLYPRLKRYCKLFVSDVSEVENIIQKPFIELWEKRYISYFSNNTQLVFFTMYIFLFPCYRGRVYVHHFVLIIE